MSLFGNLGGGGTGSSGNSLFPSLNTGTNADPFAKRKSIFEPATTQSASQSNLSGSTLVGSTPSLFGNLGTTTTTATTSAPTFSFGNTAATTNAPSGGLFAPAAPQPSTAGLFSELGAANTNKPASSTGLFGASANTPQPAGGTSLFGGFGTTTAAAAAAAPTMQQPSQPLANPSAHRESAYFNGLLERQKKKPRFTMEDQGGRLAGLPSVNMDLGDLARRAQELGSRGSTNHNAAAESRAHYLLAGSGVAPGAAYKAFQALDADGPMLERPADLAAMDRRDAYLKGLQTKGREAMMAESMQQVYKEVDAFIEQSLGIDFDEQRTRIMEHFGLIAPDENGNRSTQTAFGKTRPGGKSAGATRSVFGRSATDKSLIGTPGSTSGTTSFFGRENSSSGQTTLIKNQTMRDLRDKERLFVTKIQGLNERRAREEVCPIMQSFAEVERSANGDSPKQLVDAYTALQQITREADPAIQLRERHYSQNHVDGGPNSAGSVVLRKQILAESRTYLEKSFYQELETMLEKNPREAQLGGRPTVVNKIRAYIRVRAARHDLAPDGSELQQIGENGDYCWIMIFYLIRSGFIREAAEYVSEDPAFQSTDRRFVSYMTSYANSPERRLSRRLQEMIEGEYTQRAKIAPKGTIDPYRLACYKVLGRCDLSTRDLGAIGQGVEDWIWLQFVLAREVDHQEELSGEVFGLEQICETMTEIGQKHFQKNQIEGSSNAYGTYFLMLILAGMFEHAVDYLHNFNPVSAVHFAIALSYYGLLRVSDFSIAGNELLTYSTTQQPQINFVPLIAHYTSTFRSALPVAAVDYLTLICLNSDLKPLALGQAQSNACHECLRELCLETREFAALLGDIKSDGSRVPGAIEQRARLIHLDTREDFLKSITNQAAAIADQRGQVADAVLLYHLCEDLDHVVTVLIRALADAICIDLGESPMTLQPLKPRDASNASNGSSGDSNGPQSSLSLTESTSSPLELARNMLSLYDNNAAYYGKISQPNHSMIHVQISLLSVRAMLEEQPPQFMPALEQINGLGILPLTSRGNIPIIRAAAQNFAGLSPVLARCIGNVILWAVRAIGGERERLASQGSWDTGFGRDHQDAAKEQLSTMAKDLMIFAGMVKYKLPSRVYDMLTRAGGDVGGY